MQLCHLAAEAAIQHMQNNPKESCAAMVLNSHECRMHEDDHNVPPLQKTRVNTRATVLAHTQHVYPAQQVR